MKLVNIHILRFVIWFAVAFGAQNAVEAQTMTLQQCVETALLNNKNLQVGRNNQNLSQLKQREAKANFLPKATASADYKFFTNLPYQLMPLSTFNPTAPEGQFKEAQFGVPHNLGINVQLAMPLYNPQIKGGINATEIASELNNFRRDWVFSASRGLLAYLPRYPQGKRMRIPPRVVFSLTYPEIPSPTPRLCLLTKRPCAQDSSLCK